jgi:hypothetical protein
LKGVAMRSTDPKVKKNTIDTFAKYGRDGIKPILDIIVSPDTDDTVKQHGLAVIRNLRAQDL